MDGDPGEHWSLGLPDSSTWSPADLLCAQGLPACQHNRTTSWVSMRQHGTRYAASVPVLRGIVTEGSNKEDYGSLPLPAHGTTCSLPLLMLRGQHGRGMALCTSALS